MLRFVRPSKAFRNFYPPAVASFFIKILGEPHVAQTTRASAAVAPTFVGAEQFATLEELYKARSHHSREAEMHQHPPGIGYVTQLRCGVFDVRTIDPVVYVGRRGWFFGVFWRYRIIKFHVVCLVGVWVYTPGTCGRFVFKLTGRGSSLTYYSSASRSPGMKKLFTAPNPCVGAV